MLRAGGIYERVDGWMAAAGDAGVTDKSIRVRVAAYDGFSYTYYAWHDKKINDRRTVQAAVQEVYEKFPKYCARVELRRAGARLGVDVFKCMADRKYRWAEDVYQMVMEGDEVEIMLLPVKPGGPGVRYEDNEVLGEYEIDESAGADRAVGPLAALLRRVHALR